MSKELSRIAITGHPYAFPHYFKVFEYLKNKDRFIFIVPKVWKSKTIFNAQEKPGFTIFGLRAWSFGHQSLLGGIWKGWLPSTILLLPYLRVARKTTVLYSCSEPHLLTTLYNGVIAKLLGMRHIVFTWQNIQPQARLHGLKLRFSLALLKLNLSFADGVICGNIEAEKIIKMLVPGMKTMVCPLAGIDTIKFSSGKKNAQLLERLGIPDKKIILFYGALDDRKGVEYLIRAFKNSDHTSAHLLIIGRGPQKDRLVSLARELAIEKNVTFLDWMHNDDLPHLLQNSTVFVYPSVPRAGWAEQFGYAMAEASACGVSVIATDSGSIAEVVVDGVTGLLVPPAHTEKLSQALSKVLSDPLLAQRLGHNGREYIVKHFSHEVVAGKLESFLSSFMP